MKKRVVILFLCMTMVLSMGACGTDSDKKASAQLAELLYAKSGAKDTLFHKTQSTIKAQLAAGRNNEQVTDGVESRNWEIIFSDRTGDFW